MKPVARITGICLLGLCLSLLLASCASLRPGFEQPQVNITSFTLVPATRGTPLSHRAAGGQLARDCPCRA